MKGSDIDEDLFQEKILQPNIEIIESDNPVEPTPNPPNDLFIRKSIDKSLDLKVISFPNYQETENTEDGSNTKGPSQTKIKDLLESPKEKESMLDKMSFQNSSSSESDSK